MEARNISSTFEDENTDETSTGSCVVFTNDQQKNESKMKASRKGRQGGYDGNDDNLNKIKETKKLYLGKSYHPIFIGNWDHYLKISKATFEKRVSYIGPSTYTIMDFYLVKTLAKGKYCKIMLAAKETVNEMFVIKIISKAKVMKYDLNDRVMTEKLILSAIRFHFTLYLEGYFEDNDYLFFVMPLVAGGSLLSHLKRRKAFTEETARIYAGQILLAIEYLHHLNVIHRDIKPENVMVDHLGNLKLSAFGFSKIVPNRTYTICGTPEYMAPEILKSDGYGKSVDWWSYGVFVYELCSGEIPFYGKDLSTLYDKILAGRFSIPSVFSYDLKRFITKLLQLNLTQRIGNLQAGVNDIKSQPWFSGLNWLNLVNRFYKPTYIPSGEELITMPYFRNILSQETVTDEESQEIQNDLSAYFQNI